MHFFKKVGVTPYFSKSEVSHVNYDLGFPVFYPLTDLDLMSCGAKVNSHSKVLQMLSITIIDSLGKGRKGQLK